jgi:hypothetical protein
MPLHELWVHRNPPLIASLVNPNSEKSAEVRSEYPIYNSRFVVPQQLCEPRFVTYEGRRPVSGRPIRRPADGVLSGAHAASCALGTRVSRLLPLSSKLTEETPIRGN